MEEQTKVEEVVKEVPLIEVKKPEPKNLSKALATNLLAKVIQ